MAQATGIRSLSKPLLQVTTSLAARWISQERDKHRSVGQPLDAAQRERLKHAFQPATLDCVRVARVSLSNPPFYGTLLAWGGSSAQLLDLREVGGITYGDTIAINRARNPDVIPMRLLFHELVHVVQYQLLGMKGFSERYLLGWAESGFSYRKIPLEVEAYALEEAFAGGTLPTGPVERIVSERLQLPQVS